VDYTSLHYDLIGYTGHATFGHDPQTGAPALSGAQNQTVLSSGDLISGKLLQQPDGGFAGTITATQNAGGSAIGKVTFAINNGPPTNGPNGSLLFDGGRSTATLSPVLLS
ncbi:MAG: hypothetical protein JO110_15865, partial [Acetobacteraceae bacterium]|nr:hypothetical protein [Acetobacteraceae bacterium]